MNTAADNLFEILAENTGLRRSGDRMYGGIGFTPNSNLGITVKKKTVEVYFETYGGDKDLPAVELMDWANKSELLRKEIEPGVFFELKQGAKNKNKAALSVALPYENEEELSSLTDKIVELITMLEEKVAAIVTRKKGGAAVPSAERSEPVDETIISKVVSDLQKELGDIIADNADEIESSESFKVRPCYGYEKFYLDHIEGSYAESLQGLIHYIMWEDEIYHEFLSAYHVSAVEQLVEDTPEAIYGPDPDDEEGERIQDALDRIYWQVITYVGKELTRFDFFDNSEFEDLGFSDVPVGDSELETDDEPEPDTDGISGICESLSQRLREEAFFKPLVAEGNVTGVAFEFDSVGSNFTVTLTLDDENVEEISFDEEDAINDALKGYFTTRGIWEKLSSLGFKEEDCGGFMVMVAG